MLNSIEEHITILIYRSTYIFCLYRPVTRGHVCPSSSGGLGALPLGALRLGALPLGALPLGALRLDALPFGAFFLRISDLIGDVFSCVGRLKRVLFACSEKGVCRQYRPSPLCASCIYWLLASMAVLFQESSTLLYGLCCFLLVSKCVHLAIWMMQRIFHSLPCHKRSETRLCSCPNTI